MTGIAVDKGPPIEADFYIAAMPVEATAQLFTDNLKQAAPSIADLNKLQTRWMNGIVLSPVGRSSGKRACDQFELAMGTQQASLLYL